MKITHEVHGDTLVITIDSGAGAATRKLDRILAHLDRISKQQELDMAKTVQEVQDQADKTLAAIAEESNKDDAIILLINGNTALITSLKQQLKDAMGANPSEQLQAVFDSLVAAEASSLANAEKVLAAINSNSEPPATTSRGRKA